MSLQSYEGSNCIAWLAAFASTAGITEAKTDVKGKSGFHVRNCLELAKSVICLHESDQE